MTRLDLNGRYLAVLAGHVIRVFDVVRRQPVARHRAPESLFNLAVLEDGAVAAGDHTPQLFRRGARRGRSLGPAGDWRLRAAGRAIVTDRRRVSSGPVKVRVQSVDARGRRRPLAAFTGTYEGLQDADARCVVWTRPIPFSCEISCRYGSAIVARPVPGRSASPACGG